MITIKEAIRSQKPYVYLLCYPNGTPFYIGKGRYDRMRHHIHKATKTNMKSQKLKIIREILEKGQEVFIQIDSIHDTDRQAFNREKYLQFEYGLRIDKTGVLTNLCIGRSGRRKIKRNR